METYEQKYKEALNRARMYKGLQAEMSVVFPELKKSENELIREELINFLEVCEDTRLIANRKREKWISWLMNTKPKFKIGDWVVFNNDGTYQVENIENYEYTLRHTLGGSLPLPFCSENLIRLWTIKDAKDGDVLMADDFILIFKEIKYHQPVDSYCFHCHYDMKSESFKIDKEWLSLAFGTKYQPATKEQRSILFEKMEEVGYKWIASEKRFMKLPWGKS